MALAIDPTQFLSTYKEWHYFAGGAALGFIAGATLASILTAITYDH